MIDHVDLGAQMAMDVQGLNSLKVASKTPSKETLKAAAQQFEALFLNMMLKSMRDATPQDGMTDSDQTRMYTGMLDQQLSLKLSSRGIGLADLMVKQLGQTLPPDTPTPALANPGQAPAGSDAVPPNPASNRTDHVNAFSQKLMPHAVEASQATGVPAPFMMAQAALESGWGRHEIKGVDGQASHNLFGIKAGPSWKGASVEAWTTEYIDGQPHQTLARFRAYGSYSESFQDYAKLLKSNPRYQNVLAQSQDMAGFAQGLQQAGYATDPNYASKLKAVMQQLGSSAA
ncbi:MAG: flagellar assembly peptidoglycan hydrolase FlgJ [Thiobacillaceae bacterium]|jgi:flagellar protein FlgJ